MTTPKPATVSFEIASRWTPSLVKSGFTPVSDFFLDNYAKLSPPLKPMEAIFIIHIIQNKWTSAAPFPGYKKIADKMGMSVQAVRAIARSIERKGYLKRQRVVGATNRFHFDTLFSALETLQSQQPIEEAPKFSPNQ